MRIFKIMSKNPRAFRTTTGVSLRQVRFFGSEYIWFCLTAHGRWTPFA